MPDNPRALVTKAARHDPVLTEAAMDWASHYSTCMLPARPYRPKDKAKVEVAVQVAQRWIGAVLRNQTFSSVTDLNKAIRALLHKLNDRVMRHTGQSRLQMFEALDRPALRPLPVNRHQYASYHTGRVHPDYHVMVERNFYSVPYIHRRKLVRAKVYGNTVEVLLNGKCIDTHVRAAGHFHYVTRPEHMPPAHRAMQEQNSVNQVLQRAANVGPSTHLFCKELTLRRPYAEHAIRGIQGVLALQRVYPASRIDAACARALRLRTLVAPAVRSILRANLDRVDVVAQPQQAMPESHQNLRGASYYMH